MLTKELPEISKITGKGLFPFKGLMPGKGELYIGGESHIRAGWGIR
ncbi:MAG: hypothetical protein M0026_19840 [Nocardiopsaceae bacterium]|nr:hypothetical protein [Nocardiopsaceae bacterium]